MLTNWLKNNNLEDYLFVFDLFPTCEDRAFWDNKKNPYIIEKANNNIDYCWPIIRATSFMEYKKSGNRTIMERVYRERRNSLLYFVLAELMENNGKFMSQIVDGIFTICEETYWGVSAHWPTTGLSDIPNPKDPTIDLYAAETASTLSLIYYLLNNKLKSYCSEILDRIEYEINRRIIHQYAIHIEYWWQGYYRNINNWNPWIISNLLSTHLILVKDKNQLVKAIKKMMTEIDFYYKGLPEDGGCNEGPGYFSRAGASFCEFLYILKCATKGQINFFNDEKVKKISLYPLEMYIGQGKFVNFSDGSPNGCKSDYSILYIISREINDNNLTKLSKELFDKRRMDYVNQDLRRTLFDIQYQEELSNITSTDFDKKTYFLKDTQVLTKRQSNWFLGIKGGHNNECHNHNDVGSYVLSYNNELVVIDCGVGVYCRQTFSSERYNIWTMQSCYHNLPTINGKDQLAGEEYRADMFDYLNEELKIELHNAYDSNAKLNSFIRKAKLDNNGLDIIDEFSFIDNNNCVIEHIMTTKLPVISGDVVLIGDYVIKCKQACEITFDSVDVSKDANLRGTWNQNELYRINILVTNNNKLEYFIGRK